MAALKRSMDQIEHQIFKLGGFNLGWRPNDHQDFLRLATKFGPHRLSSLSFMNELMGLVGHITIEEVKAHVEAYKLSLELNESKKVLIKQYKCL